MDRRLIGLLVAAFLFVGTPAWAATYYVGKSGNNGNSCATAQSSTATNRKLTIAAGISCLSSGDTLIIGDGVYDESIAPDTIPSGSGAGGEAAEATWPGATVIRAETPCSGTSCTTVLRPSTAANCSYVSGLAVIALTRFSARQYIDFYGFEADANSVCIQVGRFFSQENIAPPNHIRVRNVYWHDGLASPGGSGLIETHGNSTTSAQPTYIEVLDSVITRFSMAGSFPSGGGNHCLYFSANGTIRRNVISYCSPTDGNGQAIGIHGGPGAYTVDVSGNDISFYGFQGIEASQSLNTKIYNNTVHDGSTLGCVFSGFPDVFVCAGIVAQGSGGATNTLIANNTLYNITSRNGGGIQIDGSSPGTTNTTIQNNILFGGDDDTITGSDGGTISNNRCDSGCTTSADPQFVNAAGGNFHLSISTPTTVSEGGVNLSASFTTDKDGVARTVPWSMGAYEGGAASPPAAPTQLRLVEP